VEAPATVATLAKFRGKQDFEGRARREGRPPAEHGTGATLGCLRPLWGRTLKARIGMGMGMVATGTSTTGT